MHWLGSHAYIAAWLSPLATVVGFMVQSVAKPEKLVNWSMVLVYVASLSCLAVMITPGIVGGLAFGLIIVDAMWKR